MQATRRSMIQAARAGSSAVAPSASASSPSSLGLRSFATTSASRDEPKKTGILQSILHGSEKAKAEAPTVPADGAAGGSGHTAHSGQHSHLVGRGKYIHEISKHKVKPGKTQEYKDLVAEFYEKIAKNPGDVKLTGSWEVIVGELDTFYHIFEHDGYRALDHAFDNHHNNPADQDFRRRLAPLIKTRSTDLVQEFSFWPSSPPKVLGGVYEMRTYVLKPGTLLEWEQEWRTGVEARRKTSEPIGAWFSQVGDLHKVTHVWQYPSLEERKKRRQQAWELESWAQTVSKTVKLTNSMKAEILKPLPFSPLR